MQATFLQDVWLLANTIELCFPLFIHHSKDTLDVWWPSKSSDEAVHTDVLSFKGYIRGIYYSQALENS